MDIPSPVRRTAEELDREIESIKQQIAPLRIDHLQRLRKAGAIEYEEEQLLERYEACMWLRYGVA